MNKKTKALNRKNNELDAKILPENNEFMTNMVCYLRGAGISVYDQEAIRNDLLEMVLAAQARGEGIQDVIGREEGSEKHFCDEVIAALPPVSLLKRILNGVDLLLLCVAILAVINIVLSKTTFQLIAAVFTGKAPDFALSVTAGNLLSFGFIIAAAIIIVEIIMKTSLRKTHKAPLRKSKRALIGGLIGAAVMILLLLIAWYGRTVLFSVNIFAACLFAVAAYLLHLLLNRLAQ